MACAGDGAGRRIFVSVVCYRDSECQHTLRSLFDHAARPHAVFVGVVWQMDWRKDRDCFQCLPSLPAQARRVVCGCLLLLLLLLCIVGMALLAWSSQEVWRGTVCHLCRFGCSCL